MEKMPSEGGRFPRRKRKSFHSFHFDSSVDGPDDGGSCRSSLSLVASQLRRGVGVPSHRIAWLASGVLSLRESSVVTFGEMESSLSLLFGR